MISKQTREWIGDAWSAAVCAVALGAIVLGASACLMGLVWIIAALGRVLQI